MARILFEKHDTETLALCLERFRLLYPEYAESAITYAGRLDPMAEGLLLLLTDEDVHKKDDYLGLDKIYEVSFVFGMQTDSYDILGVIEKTLDAEPEDVSDPLSQLKSITEQAYPPFSSRKVKGKPLFMYAKEGRLDTIEIPKHDIQITACEYLSVQELSKDELYQDIQKRILKVSGDFRQKSCLSSWENYFSQTTKEKYTIHCVRIHASSGTYMRSLIKTLGDMVGVPATCVHIKRVGIEGLPKNITLLV